MMVCQFIVTFKVNNAAVIIYKYSALFIMIFFLGRVQIEAWCVFFKSLVGPFMSLVAFFFN